MLTEALDRAIMMRAADVWVINNRGKAAKITASSDATTYYLDDVVVTEKQYAEYERMMHTHIKREAKCARLIRNRQFQLTRLFHHYKQETKNPIPDWEKEAYEHQEAIHKRQDRHSQ
ncbi:hypothetical protein ANK2_2781 [plant metagenome]|uniref:Phage protein n=2 Tax=plant metagenome TaxID=1297885 RepID=A0A484S6X2_9ZZZZ